jgi:glycosyltransferase involved in cell wall biosynthesis
MALKRPPSPPRPSRAAPRRRGEHLGLDRLPITLVGHPFAPIGMGEQLRSHMAAMAVVGLDYRVLDIFRHSGRTDDAHVALLGERERLDAPGGIRIFHVNGDEVERVLAAFAARGGRFADGYNVVMPAWELPRYPKVWASGLGRFDEVWAISRFVQESLAAAAVASHLIGQSVEPEPGPLLPRRGFGIRESAFVLLHFLDLSSYAARKNPQAALDLFARLRAARPLADCQLVVKVKDGEQAATEWAAGMPPTPGVHVLSEPLDTFGVKSLIAACDCFVSLHRAEGFGRGLGEAMALGRLAMGTAWSGNLDFMTEDNAILVPADLMAVPAGDYPHARGQRWATPDVNWAASRLIELLDDPEARRRRAERGRRDVLRTHGHRAVGLRVLDRLERIAPTLTAAPAAA